MGTSRHPAYRSYFFFIVAVGLAITALACYRAVADGISYHWLILASVTVLAGSVTVKIPGINSKITVADMFTFTNIVLFGPAAGTVTAALDGLAGSVRAKTASRRLEYAFFNTATMALSAQFAGMAFYRLLGGAPLYGTGGVSLRQVILPMASLGLIHHLSNSGIVAVMVALETRKGIYRIYRENFFWTLLSYLTCASVAVLIAANAAAITPFVLALLLPVLLIVYVGYKAHEDKTKERIKHRQLNELYLRTVESLALAVDAKDQTTHSHIHRVRSYAMGLADLCGITDSNELMAIRTGALLHDIGKLAVDDYILNKPGKLSPQEFEKMKMHALAGHEIVEQIQFPFPVAKYVRGHHERWDGQGYPDGLKGEGIPLGARILTIADAFDAMRSWRPYKNSLSMQDSLEELRSMAGTVFDPKLVELFIQNIPQLENMAIEASKDMPELSFRCYAEEINRALASSKPNAFHHPLPTVKTAALFSLFEFCISLGRHLDLQDLFLNLAERIKCLMPYNLCILFLEKGDGTLGADHVSGKCADVVQGLTVQIGKGVSGWVAAYQQPIMNTAAAMEFHGLDFDYASLKDTLVVPMVADENCFGTISLYAEDPMSFSQEHLALLQVVARQVSPVVAEARSDRHPAEPGNQPHTGSYLSVAASKLIAAAAKTGSPFSLIYLDLQNFSHLVKLCGVEASDSIRRQVAEGLRAELRDIDVLVQFGNKGFVALIDGWGHEAALHLTQRLQRRVRGIQVGNVAGHNVYIIQRIGIATYPSDGTTIAALLESAQHHLAMRAGLGKPGLEEAGTKPRMSVESIANKSYSSSGPARE